MSIEIPKRPAHLSDEEAAKQGYYVEGVSDPGGATVIVSDRYVDAAGRSRNAVKSEIREDVVEEILGHVHGGDRLTLVEAVKRVRTRLLMARRLTPSCGEVNEAVRRGADHPHHIRREE